MSDTDDGKLFATLLGSGSILIVGIALELGISFFGKLVIAQFFEPVDYGALSLGLTVMALTSTLTLLGLNTGIARYLPRFEDEERKRGVLVSGITIGLTLSIVVGGLIAAFAPTIATVAFDKPSMGPILRIFGLTIPLAAGMKLAIGSIQGMKDSIPRVLVQNITLPVTRIAAVMVAIVVGAEILGIAWAYLFSYLAAFAMAVRYLWRSTPLFSFDIDATPMYRTLLVFSAPLIISATMSVVLSDIDMFLLGIFRDDIAEVGVYGVVYPLAELLLVSISAFGFLGLPIVSELESNGRDEAVERVYQIVTKWMFMATFPVFLALVLFPSQSISYTFGSKYASGALGLAILATGFMSHVIAGPNKQTLTSFGRTRLVMYDTAVVAAVNVVLNLILIPSQGVLGAAVATAVSYALLNVLVSGQLYLEYGIHPFSIALVRPAAGAAALSGLLYIGITSLWATSPSSILAFFALFAVGYTGVVFRLGGVEQEEITLFLEFEEKYDLDLGPLKALLVRLR
jgi:O-antigen/teichoic acid export membrane protein